MIDSSDNYKGILRRYMDFTKLVALLENKCLFFARADIFPDYYAEGNLGHPDLLKLKYENRKPTDIELLRKNHLISCWNASSKESYGMWKTFCKDKNSIAIETTVSNLIESFRYGAEYFRETSEFSKQTYLANNLMYRKVIYYNPQIASVPAEDYCYDWRRFFHKPSYFESEEEYRLLINGQRIYDEIKDLPNSSDYTLNFVNEKGFVNKGENLEINTKKLINKIYVSPESESWFVRLVKSIVKLYGIDPDIVKKSLIKPIGIA